MDPDNIELLVQLTLMSSGWVVEDRLKVGFSPYLLPDNCVYFAPPLSGRGSWSTFKADWNAFSKAVVCHIRLQFSGKRKCRAVFTRSYE